jgi:signal transduction histidine kinase
MRIRQTLQISAVLSIASVALVTATIISLRIMDADHAAATMNSNAVVRKISLMRGFLPELSGSSHQRAVLQWQAQFAELTPILTAVPALDGRAQSLKVRILEDHAAVGALLDRLSIANQSTVAKENLEIIGDQLDVRTASMVSDVLAMNDMTAAYINRQKRWVHAVMAVSVTVLAGIIVGLLHIFHRRIVIPIVKLEEATAMFSGGKLDQPISISGSDEITALAASFDYMRIALRDRLIDLNATRTLINEENEKLAQRVEERTAELKAANQELDSFAYAVAHDLRAPLRAMSGFSQALIEDLGEQLSGDARVDLDQINIASLRMGELIDGLLVLSRPTRAELRHNAIDLSGMADGIWAELVHADPQRKIGCEIESGLTARGDARMIDAAMRNLLGNAWKYTLRTLQPSIRVYAEQKDGTRFVCVADNGAGFDMAHAGKLFQPFQRLHRQEEFPGTGIGLATVQRIVQRHGGIMKAEGAPGKGATFCFSLPPADGNKETS